MTGALIILGIAVGLVALGHVLLSMALRLPFEGRHRTAYFALVGVAVALFLAAWTSYALQVEVVT